MEEQYTVTQHHSIRAAKMDYKTIDALHQVHKKALLYYTMVI